VDPSSNFVKTVFCQFDLPLNDINLETAISDPVVFSVENPPGTSTTFMPKGYITFTREILNVGNGIDALSGVFTAPRDGTYAFHFSCGSRGANKYLGIKMHLNGAEVFENHHDGYGSGISDDEDRTMTFFHTLKLNKNDEIKLYNAIPGSVHLNQNILFYGYLIGHTRSL